MTAPHPKLHLPFSLSLILCLALSRFLTATQVPSHFTAWNLWHAEPPQTLAAQLDAAAASSPPPPACHPSLLVLASAAPSSLSHQCAPVCVPATDRHRRISLLSSGKQRPGPPPRSTPRRRRRERTRLVLALGPVAGRATRGRGAASQRAWCWPAGTTKAARRWLFGDVHDSGRQVGHWSSRRSCCSRPRLHHAPAGHLPRTAAARYSGRRARASQPPDADLPRLGCHGASETHMEGCGGPPRWRPRATPAEAEACAASRCSRWLAVGGRGDETLLLEQRPVAPLQVTTPALRRPSHSPPGAWSSSPQPPSQIPD